MENLFGQAEEAVVESATTEKKKADKLADKSKQNKEMKEKFQESCATDPDFIKKIGAMSDSLKVVHSLGYGVGGNLIQNKTASGERKLEQVPTIVGYEVQNIGSEPITYTTEEYVKDADGKYVGTVTTKVLAPQATAFLARQYMTMLLCATEYSFSIANGKMVQSSRKKDGKSLKAELESYYFTFNKEEGLSVNDDSVKVSIDEDVNGVRVIKDAYLSTFGYLNNPKERKTKSASPKVTKQAIAANYVKSLLSNAQGK